MRLQEISSFYIAYLQERHFKLDPISITREQMMIACALITAGLRGTRLTLIFSGEKAKYILMGLAFAMSN